MINLRENYFPKKTQKGFSLVELLVVIAIIGILVTIVIIAIDPLRLIQDSQDARRRTDLQAIRTSMQIYFNEERSYIDATDFAAVSGACWGIPDCSGTNTVVMKQVPKDPKGTDYLYAATPGGCTTAADDCIDYIAGAVLDNPSGGDADTITKCTQLTVSGVDATYEVCND